MPDDKALPELKRDFAHHVAAARYLANEGFESIASRFVAESATILDDIVAKLNQSYGTEV